MNVDETELEGGGYEQRYSVEIGDRVIMRMVRRPVSIVPGDGVYFVDDGARAGRIPNHSAGTFRDGKWQGVKFEPTHWTHWEDDKEARSLVDGG